MLFTFTVRKCSSCQNVQTGFHLVLIDVSSLCAGAHCLGHQTEPAPQSGNMNQTNRKLAKHTICWTIKDVAPDQTKLKLTGFRKKHDSTISQIEQVANISIIPLDLWKIRKKTMKKKLYSNKDKRPGTK